MSDLYKTKTKLEEVAHWYHYHKNTITCPKKRYEFHNKAIDNLLMIQARLVQHCELLRNPILGQLMNKTEDLVQKVRSDNEIHVDGRRNV